MPEHVMVPFKVKPDQVKKAKEAIDRFMDAIAANEPGTLYYASHQNSEDACHFVHYMIFSDSRAHDHHRHTDYVNAFVDQLYPLCTKAPTPIFMEPFRTCGPVADSIAGFSSGPAADSQ